MNTSERKYEYTLKQYRRDGFDHSYYFIDVYLNTWLEKSIMIRGLLSDVELERFFNVAICRLNKGDSVKFLESTEMTMNELFLESKINLSSLERTLERKMGKERFDTHYEKKCYYLVFALENAVFSAGAKAVGMVKSSIASAVGAGLRINSPRGCMIVDIGGGMTQVAVISSGGIVRSKAVKIAGDKFDNAIINNLKSKKDMFIGEVTAELLKVRLGSAIAESGRGMLEVSGRNERLKCAQTIRVTSDDIYGAVHAALEAICRTITGVLESSPPEIAGDISDFGIMLVGGGANIHGIDEFISSRTGLRVTVAQSPMDCECIGLGRLIEKPSIIPDGILYKNR